MLCGTHGSTHAPGEACPGQLCALQEIHRQCGDLMVLLSPSPSLGSSPAAGDRAPHLPEPVHAVLGQSHHQCHDLCWWGWCHLLPGKETSSCCTGWVEEKDIWGLAELPLHHREGGGAGYMGSCIYGARYLSYSTWLCAGNQVAGVAGISLEHVPGALSKESCLQGDSGGPLVYQTGNGWTLIGIVSWGTSNCNINTPAMYTRVSQFRNWIDAVVAQG